MNNNVDFSFGLRRAVKMYREIMATKDNAKAVQFIKDNIPSDQLVAFRTAVVDDIKESEGYVPVLPPMLDSAALSPT